MEEEREARLESLFEADLEVGHRPSGMMASSGVAPPAGISTVAPCCQQPASQYRAQSVQAHPSVAETGQMDPAVRKQAAVHSSIPAFRRFSLIGTCWPKSHCALGGAMSPHADPASHWPSCPRALHLTMRQRLGPHKSGALCRPPGLALFVFSQDGDVRRDVQPGQQEAAPDEGSGAPAARRTQASVSATDVISDALEAAEAEEKRTADHAASGARLSGMQYCACVCKCLDQERISSPASGAAHLATSAECTPNPKPCQ